MIPQPYASYRPPRLVKGPKRWYVEYWFRVPDELRERIKKEWKRFKVFEDINRSKEDKEHFADELLKAVELRLLEGYNPFTHHTSEWRFAHTELTVSEISLNTGLDNFIAYSKDKKLRDKTIQTYGTIVNFLKIYFTKNNKIYQPISSFTKQDIKMFIADMKKSESWENYTTNNYISLVKTVFNYFVKEDIIPTNPAKTIEELPVQISRHTYYSDEIAEKIKASLKVSKPELLEFCEFIYYSAVRPKSEARKLQVKHILFDRKLLFVPKEINKNGMDQYIPMGEELIKLLESRKGQPGDHYIFGGQQIRSMNHFSYQYKPYKDKLGLGEEYTLYSWKHTRAIHLAQAGADPYQIMRLFRHGSLEMTMKYLRDLGQTDLKELHAKTKKF